jgi:hypothetical protein
LDRSGGVPPALLGARWRALGQDGGTEAEAWRRYTGQDQRALGHVGRTRRASADGAPRGWTGRLFHEGWMAVVVLGVLALLGPVAWFLGGPDAPCNAPPASGGDHALRTIAAWPERPCRIADQP